MEAFCWTLWRHNIAITSKITGSTFSSRANSSKKSYNTRDPASGGVALHCRRDQQQLEASSKHHPWPRCMVRVPYPFYRPRHPHPPRFSLKSPKKCQVFIPSLMSNSTRTCFSGTLATALFTLVRRQSTCFRVLCIERLYTKNTVMIYTVKYFV